MEVRCICGRMKMCRELAPMWRWNRARSSRGDALPDGRATAPNSITLDPSELSPHSTRKPINESHRLSRLWVGGSTSARRNCEAAAKGQRSPDQGARGGAQSPRLAHVERRAVRHSKNDE